MGMRETRDSNSGDRALMLKRSTVAIPSLKKNRAVSPVNVLVGSADGASRMVRYERTPPLGICQHFFLRPIDKNVKGCYLFIMSYREKTLAEWYIETSEDFWSGHWNGSDAAFVFAGLIFFLMFAIPLNWSDIMFYIGFTYDVLMQPIYGGCALYFFARKVSWKRRSSTWRR